MYDLDVGAGFQPTGAKSLSRELVEMLGFVTTIGGCREAEFRLANRLTRLFGSLRSVASSWSVGSISGESGPPSLTSFGLVGRGWPQARRGPGGSASGHDSTRRLQSSVWLPASAGRSRSPRRCVPRPTNATGGRTAIQFRRNVRWADVFEPKPAWQLEVFSSALRLPRRTIPSRQRRSSRGQGTRFPRSRSPLRWRTTTTPVF